MDAAYALMPFAMTADIYEVVQLEQMVSDPAGTSDWR